VSLGAFTTAGTASAPLNVNNTISIGNTALASADNSIAIGLNATASATSAIAIGNGSSVTGLSSGAVGDPNVVSGAGSYAVGNNNTIAANNAFALGNGITIGTGLDGAVALGNSTTVAAPVPTSSVTIGAATYTLAGGSPTSVVSVGSPGAERQITNVAAGQITATSTDAVNGSELYATNQAVANLVSGGSGTVQYSNAGTPTTPNGGVASQNLTLLGAATGPVTLHNVAAGSTTVASTDAINGGQLNTVASSIATNLGGGSTYNATTGALTSPSYTIQGTTYGNVGTALGAVNNNLTALNADVNGMGTPYFQANSTQASASATGSNSIAVGPTSVASAADSIAIGSGASASTAQSVALGSGATTAAAVATSGTTIRGTNYTFAGAQPAGVVSVGAPGAERQVTNVAAGQISATSTDAVNGSELYATNLALNSLTSGGAGTVQYSSAAKPTVPNGGVASQNLTLVGATTAPVTLHNVAPGVAPTDAVNVQQLNNETSGAVSTVEQYLNSHYLGLSDQVNAVQRNADAGTASAMAMSGVPQSYLPGKSMLGAGVAGYGSESSLAVGLSTLSDNGRWVLKLNGSANTRGKYGATAGAGVTW
jgi:autotransporter adhesin